MWLRALPLFRNNMITQKKKFNTIDQNLCGTLENQTEKENWKQRKYPNFHRFKILVNKQGNQKEHVNWKKRNYSNIHCKRRIDLRLVRVVRVAAGCIVLLCLSLGDCRIELAVRRWKVLSSRTTILPTFVSRRASGNRNETKKKNF